VTGSTTQPDVAARRSEAHGLTAFGLRVTCDWPLTGARPVSSNHEPPSSHGLPSTHIRCVDPAEVDELWRAPAQFIFGSPEGGDGLPFTVERAADQYRFWLEGFGRYVISAGGGDIGCERDGAVRARQERFVFAQGLPAAAVLSGYEALHASSVSAGDEAVAFVGASGSGKTSLASRLVAAGAGLVTDDVLAVETRDGAAVVHSGPPFMVIRREDAAIIEAAEGRLGTEVGATDKLHVSPPSDARDRRLRILYHLEPGPSFALAPMAHVDLRRMLGLAFIPYITTEARLRRHLEIVQAVNANALQFRLQMPPSGADDEIVGHVADHIRRLTV
jgi:hypothetical protein